MARLAPVLAILAIAGAVLIACDGDSVSYRPPTAAIAERVDCLAPDIDSKLSALNSSNIDPGRPPSVGVGYPPRGFTPVAVVRCERGENTAGALTIDSVRLEGDVEAAWDAFRVDSKRFPDNVQASCAVAQNVPAGLWFVDADGRAVRPAWPAAPCGYQRHPIAVLAELHEVDRPQQARQLPADNPGVCSEKYGSGFITTTDADVQEADGADRRSRLAVNYALAFPIDDVGRLQVCRFIESAGASTQQSRSRLTIDQSVDLVREVIDAPPAPPCALTATRTAQIPLYRADGSGGAKIDIELDGCRRATGTGIPYVAVPATVTAAADEPSQ
ncbi:hypothetical protein [Rhodococcus sp. UNC363MFTsu5.1]|uniref:hypothetical protein n=1 Tax=Rhodococcus sp. UNC363MFTsu5.1 TaxID=1449069 RepID=UPI00068B228A|nr:hypothetical protein [Rhodococcus sp. UNC363MFTsu5.1]